MIRVIPSISILDGKCAKLAHGDTKNARLFDQNPLDLAKFFEDNGAEWLHMVDLDGAKQEEVVNSHILEVIAGHTNLKINFSGGIRTDGGVNMALSHGAKTVTVATLAAQEPDTFMQWIISYGRGRLILGADVSNGKILTRGWARQTNTTLWDHIDYFYNRSVQFVKITDVDRDGNLEGPNFDLYREAVERYPNMNIVASGGVRSVADIEKLNELGVWAVIIASAFYEDKLDIHDLRPFFEAAQQARV